MPQDVELHEIPHTCAGVLPALLKKNLMDAGKNKKNAPGCSGR